MQEIDAIEFYDRVVSDRDRTEEITLEHQSGAGLTMDVIVVDRKELLDEISRLPEEMLETISEAEDEAEAKEEAEEKGMMNGVNGDTILAFENICKKGLRHDELTSMNIDDMVEELSFEALFPLGSKVIEMGFENSGTIEDFHEVDSDKSS